MDWENWKPECEEAELTERESARLRREQAKFDAALEDSAEKLVQLHLDELNALGLPDEMLDAVHVARGIKPSRALKRQTRLITRMLRHLEEDEVKDLMGQLHSGADERASLLKYCEFWRTSLLEAGDPALSALLDICPDADRQRLRQLIRTAGKGGTDTKKERAYKEIFQLLKDLNPSTPPPPKLLKAPKA
ncbi:MAG: ribosome biogenesis factor YjgA [Myxococcota bacterium]|nr:ribosome biogenesis factor YjgA [Myxococcota bacterium]